MQKFKKVGGDEIVLAFEWTGNLQNERNEFTIPEWGQEAIQQQRLSFISVSINGQMLAVTEEKFGVHKLVKVGDIVINNGLRLNTISKEDFAKQYAPYAEETFFTRLVKERDELDEKIVKLTSFISQEKFEDLDATQQTLLQLQCQVMRSYAMILTKRIDLLHNDTVDPKSGD